MKQLISESPVEKFISFLEKRSNENQDSKQK